MESSNFTVLLHDIFPHKANTTQASTLIGIDIQREVISRGGNEAPISFMSASDKELVASAAQVRGDCISPFCGARIVHLHVNLILVECPPLMCGNVDCLELPWVWRQIHTLVHVDRRWLCGICYEKNGSQPDPSLEIHIGITQVG